MASDEDIRAVRKRASLPTRIVLRLMPRWMYREVVAEVTAYVALARPIPEGMIRVEVQGRPPICVPPTLELLDEMNRVVDIVKGDER